MRGFRKSTRTTNGELQECLSITFLSNIIDSIRRNSQQSSRLSFVGRSGVITSSIRSITRQDLSPSVKQASNLFLILRNSSAVSCSTNMHLVYRKFKAKTPTICTFLPSGVVFLPNQKGHNDYIRNLEDLNAYNNHNTNTKACSHYLKTEYNISMTSDNQLQVTSTNSI